MTNIEAIDKMIVAPEQARQILDSLTKEQSLEIYGFCTQATYRLQRLGLPTSKWDVLRAAREDAERAAHTVRGEFGYEAI